jgi:FkbM family methyltransferase
MTFWSTVHSILRPLGIDVCRWHEERQEPARVIATARSASTPTIIDVGANIGQFGLGLIKAGFKGDIISFEPLAPEYERLLKRARTYPNWKVAARSALGDKCGAISIHRASNSASSSIFNMRNEHIAAAPYSKYVSEEVVSIRRLDECSEIASNNDRLFLKIDTQGFELHVLRGATGIISRIHAMMLEVSLVPLYDQAPLFEEVFEHIKLLGFQLVDIVPGFQSPSGQMLQVNLIATRKQN